MKRRRMYILVALAVLAGSVLLAISIGPCATPSSFPPGEGDYYTDFPIRDNGGDDPDLPDPAHGPEDR